jgi:class 3 adenylate cyclase
MREKIVAEHTGEVELAKSDVRGITVHIASRVANLGGADDVLVSRTVKDLVAGSGIRFEDFGMHAPKGLREVTFASVQSSEPKDRFLVLTDHS